MKLAKFLRCRVWLILIIYLVLGYYNPGMGIAAVFCMLAPICGALYHGRAWCGWFCPRGSFNDYVLSRFRHKGMIPNLFHTMVFRIGFLVLLTGNVFQMLRQQHGSIIEVGRIIWLLVLFTTIIDIILGLTFHPRSWCSFCPMGTIAYGITKIGFFKKRIIINRQSCLKCKKCEKICPLQIKSKIYGGIRVVTDDDCIYCRRCQEKCPANHIQKNKFLL